MDLFKYTVTALLSVVTNPSTIMMMFVLGFLFYMKNKKIVTMQKLIIGENVNSALELTLSQIVLGIIAGVLASALLSFTGVVFTEATGILCLFVISIILNFIKPRFICFSYSGAILGVISIITEYALNNKEGFHIDIMCLMIFVGVMHIIEAVLVFFDGDRGAIPVFSRKEEKIVGGYALNRSWIFPIVIMIALRATEVSSTGSSEAVATPDWWPLISTDYVTSVIATMLIGFQTFFGILGYSSVTFSRSKQKKKRSSGIFILIYGVLLVAASQLTRFGLAGEIAVIILAPLGHEAMLIIQRVFENEREDIFVSNDEGISILEIVPESQFYSLGVRAGDRIVSINEVEIKSEKEVYKIAKSSFTSLAVKIRTLAGEIRNIKITEKHENGFRILLVPKNINKETVVPLEKVSFSDVLHKIKDEDNDDE